MASAKTNTLKRLIKARALRQGLIGGSPLWRAIWISQFAYKQFSKLSKGGDPPISFDEPLKEGEVWALVHEPEKSKKGRGEGRKFLIGPKRKRSRANIMTGLALGVVGEKILAAPSAERINQILGEDVFDPPPISKKEKRAVAKAAKLDAKAARRADRDAKRRAKQAARDATLAEKQAARTAKHATRDATRATRTKKRSKNETAPTQVEVDEDQ